MATELLQPGVSVIQEFRTVSPTIVTPTLVPCTVAPAFQILDALTTDATGNRVLNTQAVVSAPAALMAYNPGPYMGLNGLTLIVSINNGPNQTITFSDPTSIGLDAGGVKDQIALAAPTGFSGYVLDISGSEYLQLRTTATGDGQLLKIGAGSANTVLGFKTGYQVEGATTYNQTSLHLDQDSFPDPKGIIDEVDVDESSIRAFVNTGTTLKELLRTTSFLRRKKSAIYTSGVISFPISTTGKVFSFMDGYKTTRTLTFSGDCANVSALVSAMNTLIGSTKVIANGSTKIDLVTTDGYIEILTPASNSAHALIGWTDGDKAYTISVVDDGNGDALSPIVVATQDNFTAPGGSATVTGSVAITTELEIHNKTIEIALDGGRMQEILVDAGPIKATAVLNTSNTLDGESLSMIVNGTAKTVTFSGTDPLPIATVVSQINAAAGTTVAYRSNASGVADPVGTYVSYVVGGASPVAGATVALSYAGAGDTNTWTDLGIIGLVTPGSAKVVYQAISKAEIITLINGVMGAGFATDASNYIKLTSTRIGNDSIIRIGKGTANTDLGFTSDAVYYGDPLPPQVGDEIWADGTMVGKVAMVAPGGYANRLKLDRQLALTWGAAAFYIQSQNIPTSLPASRPLPDMYVDLSGAVNIKPYILRNTDGVPITASGQLVISYKALRLDVSSSATTPALLTFDSVESLEEAIPPLTPENPLGLMTYFTLINAPGISVSAIGVDGVNSSNPDGTPEAYARALGFLEAQEVYALAPASQDPTVHQSFSTHVTAISQPDSKGERIAFICPRMPSEDLPTLVTSGQGDSTVTTNVFDTHVASLAADLLAAGVDPIGTIPVSAGVYLDVASNANKYSVASLSGTAITVRVAFAAGENDDNFYATTNLPATLIAENFTIYVRGVPLVTSTDEPDYARIAEAYQKLGQVYLNRRLVMVAPETVGATIDGTEQELPGYYLCAALAGMVGQLAPQQGFTNYPIAGFTRVKGSNDVFTRRQMNVGAAGGTYWVVQETAGAPLSTRHQLTTDMTSIETRELSITKIVDFVAKFMRAGLRNFIGRFNITQPFLDMLSTVIQGQISYLTSSGVLVGADLNNIVQDSTAPDTVLIDVTLDVPYPCNYIRLTLIV